MKYNIQSVGVKLSDDIHEMVMDKMDGLAKKYDWIIGANVFFKKESKDVNVGNICEIRLSGPGPLQFASSNEPSFELAITETTRKLSTLLEKRKEIMNSRDKISH